MELCTPLSIWLGFVHYFEVFLFHLQTFQRFKVRYPWIIKYKSWAQIVLFIRLLSRPVFKWFQRFFFLQCDYKVNMNFWGIRLTHFCVIFIDKVKIRVKTKQFQNLPNFFSITISVSCNFWELFRYSSIWIHFPIFLMYNIQKIANESIWMFRNNLWFFQCHPHVFPV